MCIHPEALTRTKNFSPYHDKACHTVHREPMDLPSKAQWMIRQTNHPSNQIEKFDLRAETEKLRQ
jgi:hypothetical protein